jgi:uncharacterized protein (DUF2267 family)
METRTQSEWIENLRRLGPFADDESASRALIATLEALAALLTRDERESLSISVPLELRPVVLASRPHAQAAPDEFFRQVAAREGARRGLAIEHAELVCLLLREMLPAEARLRLEHALPQLAQLFAAPPAYDAPAHPGEREGETLATGRPGSKRPLSGAH